MRKQLGEHEITFSLAVLIYPLTYILQTSYDVNHGVCVCVCIYGVALNSIYLCEQIIPQSVCSRYGLAIGAAVTPFVRVLLWVCFPIAYPISKVSHVDLALVSLQFLLPVVGGQLNCFVD